MQLFSNYGKLCTEVYALTKPIGTSINGDIEYYLSRLAGVQGNVLEPAVGSGRFYVPLLEHGLNADGIDASAEMLLTCKQSCLERGLTSTVKQGNMENFKLEQSYEAIVVPTGSFLLLEKREAAMSALTNFYHHLEAGGRLILDLFFPYDFKQGEATTTVYQLDSETGITLTQTSAEINWLEQTTVSYAKYEKWHRGAFVESELERFVLSWYGMNEFKCMLTDVGFKNISCSSNYVYNKAPKYNEDVITFEATR